jgi:hypothetical protein
MEKSYSEKDVVAFTNPIGENMRSLINDELNHHLMFFVSIIK